MVSSSGTKPIRATPACEVDQAGLAGQHDRGEHVVGAPGHRDDVGLDDLGAEPVRAPRGWWRTSSKVRAPRRVERRRGAARAGGARRSSRGEQRAALVAGEVGVAPGPLAEPVEQLRRAAWWWASACSRTSIVARCSPNAASVRIARSSRPRRSARRGAAQRVAHELEVGEQLGGAEVVAAGLVRRAAGAAARGC